jgi:SAM-dependent methyltransferase
MTSPSQADSYTHGHHQSVVAQHARRTASEAAAFLLPHLKPGMKLLDFGCGPGSITVGLAQAVSPGLVTAVDVAAEVLQHGRALASEQGLTNVSFEEGSVYELAFPEATFDVAFGHQVLQHLSRPHEALEELKRVLEPGGILAVRDSDYATMPFAPDDPRLDRFFAIYDAVARRNGAEPNAGRYLRGWLLAAGFVDVEVSTTTWTYVDKDEVTNWGNSWADRVLNSNLGKHAVEYGIASRTELEEVAQAWREWAAKPGAFFALIQVAALGRKAA